MDPAERKRADAEERLAAEHPAEHLRRREFLARTAALAGIAGLASAVPLERLLAEAARKQRVVALPNPRNVPIDHFVVLMMENRSFDHYFGWRADADGRNAGLSYPDKQGVRHPTHTLAPDFQGCAFMDPNHEWDGARLEYNNGKLDGFYEASDNFAIGYYLEQDLSFIPSVAQAFTLYDRYFASVLGPTWPNREYMHSAQCGGTKVNGSPSQAAQQSASGGLYRWETIWDRAAAAGISAAYYGSDLPFIGVFGKRYNGIVKSVSEFYADAAAGNLPNLAFVDPPFLDGGGGNGLSGDEHPHGDIRIGQAFQSSIAHAFLGSPNFRNGAMFINYDEWGGFFDHVSPRIVPDDRSSNNLEENFGITGFRVPAVTISPYAKRGHVSHATMTHESILKFISYRFGLGYLNKRHRYASNIGRTLDFSKPNFDVPALPSPLPPAGVTPCAAQPARAPGASRASAQTAHGEGPSLGSPEVVAYLESIGYKVTPASADQIFPYPSKAREALGELWKANAKANGP